MSVSETGYAKNAANLKDLIIRLKALGDAYQAPKPALSIDQLEKLLLNAENLNRVLSDALPLYNKRVDEQELIFATLSKLVTRSYNYLKVITENPAELETTKTIADKIRGVTKNMPPAEENAKSRSQAQTSYDNRLENFRQYIAALQTAKNYNPAEGSLSIEALNALAAKLEESLTAVELAKTNVDEGRKNRFTCFYAEQTGLVDTALSVKTLLKAVLSKNHPEYAAIQAIKFTNA